MKGVVIILGNRNDEQGNLLELAVGRLDKGIEEYHSHPDYKILLTGGRGAHFNTTDKPHAFYARQYLLERRIAASDLLEFAESYDTVEDALLSKPIVDKYKGRKLIIVSSDFHMDRVKYIFKKVFKGYHLSFEEAITNPSPEQLEVLMKHEIDEICKLKNEGIQKR